MGSLVTTSRSSGENIVAAVQMATMDKGDMRVLIRRSFRVGRISKYY
jgi:hypothetical protein